MLSSLSINFNENHTGEDQVAQDQVSQGLLDKSHNARKLDWGSHVYFYFLTILFSFYLFIKFVYESDEF